MSSALRRLAIVPFETAIALLLLSYGVAGLAQAGLIDPVSALLPHWEAVGLYIITGFTGILMIAGTGAASRGTEAAGLLFLAGVIADRFLLYGYYLGFGANFAVTGVFDAAIVWATIARLNTLRRNQIIIRVQNGHASAAE